jgi:hypothetical protein
MPEKNAVMMRGTNSLPGKLANLAPLAFGAHSLCSRDLIARVQVLLNPLTAEVRATLENGAMAQETPRSATSADPPTAELRKISAALQSQAVRANNGHAVNSMRRSSALTARLTARVLSRPPHIEDIEHGAIGSRGSGTLGYRPREQPFELAEVSYLRTDVVEVMGGDLPDFAA